MSNSWNNERPRYVSTVLEGFRQSEDCEYFIGSTQRFIFGNGTTAVVMFCNPTASGVNVYMNKISSCNLSNSPVAIDIYTGGRAEGDLKRSFDIVPGNLNCRDKVPKTQLYYGEDANVLSAQRIFTETIEPYVTLRGAPSGSIILPPGTNRVYLFQTICPGQLAKVSMGFNWWEQCDNSCCNCM